VKARPLSGVLVGIVLAGLAETRAAVADGERASLDQARRLTSIVQTREEGIQALRTLAVADPAALAPRLELARVLTWSVSGRGEGIGILHRLEEEYPGNADVVEELARVLSWEPATRSEAIDRLRSLVGRAPDRISSRLLLAEILSWDPRRRDEAEDLYRRALEQHGNSVEARVGLGRLLSWRGDLGEARALYESALALAPLNSAARIGLAEAERWAGRPRASLRALASLPPDQLQTPEAREVAADAYSDLGRPSRALGEYEAILEVDAGREAARKGAHESRRLLRPTLAIGVDGGTESGDPETSRLETVGMPVTFAWVPGADVRLGLHAATGQFRNQRGRSRWVSAGAGVEAPLGNRLRATLDLRAFDLPQGVDEITGRLELRAVPAERVEIALGATRELLLDSLLTAAGEEIGGVFYGPVIQAESVARVTVDVGGGWEIFLSGGRASIEGDSVLANHRQAFFAGFGRSIRAGRAWLKPGYTWTRMSYDLDLGGFPPDALAGDGVTSRGVGGYFSPFRFQNQMIRLDAAWPVGSRVRVEAGGGVGQQQIEDTGAGEFHEATVSSDVRVELSVRATEGLTIRVELTREDVASAFDRTRSGIHLQWSF